MAQRSLVLAMAVAVALAGCGRKGSLEPPGTPPETSTRIETVIGAGAPAAPPPEEKPAPDTPFILDILI